MNGPDRTVLAIGGVVLAIVIASGPPGADRETILATIQSHLPTGYVVRSASRSD